MVVLRDLSRKPSEKLEDKRVLYLHMDLMGSLMRGWSAPGTTRDYYIARARDLRGETPEGAVLAATAEFVIDLTSPDTMNDFSR
jgi:hypothetical protein